MWQYLEILWCLIYVSKELIGITLFFQQKRATCHTLGLTMAGLRQLFPGHQISRFWGWYARRILTCILTGMCYFNYCTFVYVILTFMFFM